jgi:signal transduction histidine kinase
VDSVRSWLSILLSSDSQALYSVCLMWPRSLWWTEVLSDAAIALSYFTIPIFLTTLVVRRPGLKFGWIFWAFAVFITACGTGHLVHMLSMMTPNVGYATVVKMLTAAASVGTAAAVWFLLPKLLALPTSVELAAANQKLQSALEALHHEQAERLSAEASLRQAQKMEAIGRLTGGIAHDFNNLLQIVVGHGDILRRRLGVDADPRAVRALDNMQTAASRAAQLTGHLLSFSRRQQLQAEELDLNFVAQQTVALAHSALGDAITFSWNLSESLDGVWADATQTQTAILNILINARDAMEGRGHIHVATENARIGEDDDSEVMPGAYVRLSITDNGCGMDKETMTKVFEPFFTTKGPEKGTGLGLSQVFGFLSQSGGTVSISSEVGCGTTITMLFPSRKGGEDAGPDR